MADVQDIEASVGEDDFCPFCAPLLHTAFQVIAAQDLLFAQCGLVSGGDFSIASNNSCLETVAVPRFMTTIPAA